MEKILRGLQSKKSVESKQGCKVIAAAGRSQFTRLNPSQNEVCCLIRLAQEHE